MTLRVLVVGALLGGPSLASAEAPVAGLDLPGTAPMYGFVGEQRPDGMVLARQVLPAKATPTGGELVKLDAVQGEVNVAALAQSKIVYLNRKGVTLLPAADNDARLNRSTIVSSQTSFAPWNVSANDWSTVLSCMRDLFSAYDVQIVDTDPGNVPHMEAVFGGSPAQVGMDTNVLGVSPFTLGCDIIENSIVFTFTGAGYAFTPREACEVMAQEVAHSYGLDHELLASDPMTYLPYTGNRTFKNQAASCGEDMAAPRQCGINGSVCRANQNSVALLTERLGLADAVAPVLAFASPPNNSTVPPGFQVKASGTDNKLVTGAALKIDGVQVDQITGAGPYVFITSQTMREGAHTIVVELSDGKNYKSETRSVTVKIGAAPPVDQTGDALDSGDIVGGCSASGGSSTALLGLGLLAAITARRRRRR